ncbi:hypothetical protein chiPu_0030595 [Chiloscyllium punctatum]|uniref:Uncharacterized protein n=1 Tax=Chiloscyllium punctatum TaxID=137246 RepID=A0A401TV23_CHIPU|nr:hypothetical protein [Chiloscyllium punctatum]
MGEGLRSCEFASSMPPRWDLADLLCWDHSPRRHGCRQAHFLRSWCAATDFGSAGKAGGFGRWPATFCGKCYSPLAISFAVPPELREATADAPSCPPRVVRGTVWGKWARRAPSGSVNRGVLSSVRPNRVLPLSRVKPRRAGARGLRRCR